MRESRLGYCLQRLECAESAGFDAWWRGCPARVLMKCGVRKKRRRDAGATMESSDAMPTAECPQCQMPTASAMGKSYCPQCGWHRGEADAAVFARAPRAGHGVRRASDNLDFRRARRGSCSSHARVNRDCSGDSGGSCGKGKNPDLGDRRNAIRANSRLAGRRSRGPRSLQLETPNPFARHLEQVIAV